MDDTYPLLSALLVGRGMELKGSYKTREVAEIFEVTVRTIQARIKEGLLHARHLPGGRRCLAEDLESFLRASGRPEDGK